MTLICSAVTWKNTGLPVRILYHRSLYLHLCYCIPTLCCKLTGQNGRRNPISRNPSSTNYLGGMAILPRMSAPPWALLLVSSNWFQSWGRQLPSNLRPTDANRYSSGRIERDMVSWQRLQQKSSSRIPKPNVLLIPTQPRARTVWLLSHRNVWRLLGVSTT